MSNQQLPAFPSDLSAQTLEQSSEQSTDFTSEQTSDQTSVDARSALVSFVTSCELPTNFATFQMHAFIEHATGKEHIALTLGDVADGEPVLTRLHSECLTGDALFSQRCDCGPQLEMALKKLLKRAGVPYCIYARKVAESA